MIDAARLATLQTEAVARWHVDLINDDCREFDALAFANHEINFRLWHEEDQARDPSATDIIIAQVKRRIDRLNQQRSDSIEQLDNAILDVLATRNIGDTSRLPMNTESPGSAIDRLSILALRVYHLAEQIDRPEISDSARSRVAVSLRVAERQRANLVDSLQQLFNDIFAGRKQHQTFRQLKMYNDPELNPVIYKHKQPRSTD